MSQTTMTPQDVKAMEAARVEFQDAVKAFDAAIQQRKSKTEIAETLNMMIEKQTTYLAFGEKFFQKYPQPPLL